MDNAETSPLADKMDVLRGHYLVHLSEKMKAIEVLRHVCCEGALPAQAQEELKTLVHQLAGGGGVYGFPTISETASLIDAYLKDTPIPDISRIRQHMDTLYDVCRTAIDLHLSSPSDSSDAEGGDLSLPLIAVVDDDPMIRLAYKFMFRGKARLVMGKNTFDAHDIMLSHQPKLVLLDDIMPGAPTGLTFLESIRKDPDLSQIPVIMVTASNNKDDVLRGLAAGAADYVIKPFAPEKLVGLVMSIVSRQDNHVILAMEDGGLAFLLQQRLIALRCKVDVVAARRDALPSVEGHAHAVVIWDSGIFSLDQIRQRNSDSPFAYSVFLGDDPGYRAYAEQSDRMLVIPEGSIDGIIRSIGQIMAKRRKATHSRQEQTK